MSDTATPLIRHLLELRRRLLWSLGVVAVLFLLLLPWANGLYHQLALPLLRSLPSGGQMIATDITTPFMIPIKLTFHVALFVSIPWLLWQLWAFVAPGLYLHERKLILPLVISSAALFYLGMAFAYWVVCPLLFAFLVSTAPQGVTLATDIASYLSFILGTFLAFGMAFEVPVAICVLCWAGLTTPAQLVAFRRWFIVAAFVIAMLLTPPDVLSQVMLAIPLCLLYELGILLSRYYASRRTQLTTTNRDDPDGDKESAPHD